MHSDFDFDYWRELAERDPQAFERERQAHVQALIDDAPAEQQQRLTGLQWKVDRIRELSSNPMDSCLKISKMMMDQVHGEDGLVDHLKLLLNADMVIPERKRESADVVPLQPKP